MYKPRIQKTIKTALAGKTVVMITHRVSLASNADMIVVLDKGRIIQLGTHAELVEQAGTYKKIYDIQTQIDAELDQEIASATTAVNR